MRAGKLLLFCVTFALTMIALPLAEPRADQPAMRLGQHVLAPFGLVQYCLHKPTRCKPSTGPQHVALNEQHRTQLEQVQGTFNRRLVRGPAEPNAPWSDEATVDRCTEFALAKRSRLLDLGFPSSALSLAVAIVPSRGHHLVLVVVTDQGDFVLDNLRVAMIRWDKLPYRWVMRSTQENVQFWRLILPQQSSSETRRVRIARADVAALGCADKIVP